MASRDKMAGQIISHTYIYLSAGSFSFSSHGFSKDKVVVFF